MHQTRLLSEGQLTQVKSFVQATINETIEQTATPTAQAAMNAFANSASSNSSPSQAASPEVHAPSAVALPSSAQETLNSQRVVLFARCLCDKCQKMWREEENVCCQEIDALLKKSLEAVHIEETERAC